MDTVAFCSIVAGLSFTHFMLPGAIVTFTENEPAPRD